MKKLKNHNFTKFMIDEKKKYVSYSRVSSQKQKDDETILIQLDKIKKYAQEHPEIDIVEKLEDDGVSGLKDETGRPGYKRLKELINAPEIKGVICASLDRLGRSNLELQRFFNDIITHGKKDLILLSHNLDTSTKEGKFAFDVLSAQVEYDVRNTKERLKAGWDRAYNETPDIFGRPTKEVPEKLKNKIINWYKTQKEGFHRISNLILAEDIKSYPDWFQKEYKGGFGRPPKKKKKGETTKKKKDDPKKFYLSPTLVGNLLKKWEIEIRDPKFRKNKKDYNIKNEVK